MKILVKNMVCPRCILAVSKELKRLRFPQGKILLGEVEVLKDLSEKQFQRLEESFCSLGFEIIHDRKTELSEKIKMVIIDLVHHEKFGAVEETFREIISRKLNKDYSYLSRSFSETQKITIEQFFIRQKIERAKELIGYGQNSIKEISFQLGYSSLQHLSSQFKSVAGLSPRQYQSKKNRRRKSLDRLV